MLDLADQRVLGDATFFLLDVSDETGSALGKFTKGRVSVKEVTIWETDTTTARYSE
jgi:hypothetical protein